MKHVSRIAFFLGTGVGLLGLVLAMAWLIRPQLGGPAEPLDTQVARQAQQARSLQFDISDPLVLWRDVDYGAGEEAPWRPRGEPPVLKELVDEGRLPPVGERVGPEPLVMEGVDGVGRYGGSWNRAILDLDANPGAGELGSIASVMSGVTLVRWSPQGYPIVPHLARHWEVSEDLREWTFHLRRGLKWSDGHPFTVDDILYWWDWHIKYFGGKTPLWMRVGGKAGEIVKVDSHTVKFVFPVPNGLFLDLLAFVWDFYRPQHYMEPYHPELGDPQIIEAGLKATGLPSADALYGSAGIDSILNPDMPRMWPWIYRTYSATPPHRFVRNPYFFAVDSAGNQLPYIDQLVFEHWALNQLPGAAASGRFDFQARNIDFEHYTLLMSQRERFGYEVYHWYPADRSRWALWFNLNRYVDPEDEATSWKSEYLKKPQFRQALSLAIDREEIIQAVYLGVGEPSQVAPGPESYWHYDKLSSAFTAFDPDRARALLDEIGLTVRDAEGYRAFPDGTRMVWYINYSAIDALGPAEFVVDYWAQVGVRTVIRVRNRSLYQVEMANRRYDILMRPGLDEFNPLIKLRSYLPDKQASNFARGFGAWFASGGMEGELPPDIRGAVEPPPGHPLRQGMELLPDLYAARTREEQKEILNRLLDFAAENVWSISIATPPPQLAVVKKGFKNVPRHVLFGTSYLSPVNAGLETFYLESPEMTASLVEQIQSELIESSPRPASAGNVAAGESGVEWGKWLARGSFWLSVGLLLYAARRHPFVARRLAILVPTLAIISLVVFAIIQLPPSSYIEAKVLQAEITGEDSAVRYAEELRRLFPYDAGFLEKYVQWMGLKWFVTFESGDLGLLQGHLGWSMEHRLPVNQIIGDRLALTVAVSIGTILFTWAIALPIGIYSAVKQYTIGDYIFTLIGFLGMCVPNFLLAIILTYIGSRVFQADLTGLFSAKYAAQPDWDWAKFVDLLKHIWVPVIVVGMYSTASMIRIMRANLLDELSKPYVTTARAKGVRPLKLLVKYPVRLALNPFVSGIGALFPQLISGAAIVALVLSLPMVGPMMLMAFMSEDLYLAASMLVLLSVLATLGTLVSDLLLMWLDPRIRMEGGKR